MLSAEPNLETLKNLKEKLEALRQQMCNLDEKILDAMVDGEATEQEIGVESENAEQYTDNIRVMLRKIDKVMDAAIQQDIPGCDNNSVAGSAVNNTKKTYKLPTLEIRKFNGEFINWLTFWGQFEKIHNDTVISDADKCQYLFQSMKIQ